MTYTLTVTPREAATGTRAGDIPGVVYGPKQESLPLSMDRRTFEKLFRDAGESTIINLEGVSDEVIEVLIHDVTFDPVKGDVQHVDFYAIERGKELTTNVTLEFEGESPAVKDGGVLTKALYEIEVTCRPSKLPPHLVVDISSITELETPIRVKDLEVPEGVTINTDPEETVAVVVPVQEEAEEPVEAVDMDAIEVEEKGKGEVDEGEAKDTAS